MYLPNLIMDILIGLAFIIKVSVLNIYSRRKIRIINPIEYLILIFTL